jgi:hypothetical protein
VRERHLAHGVKISYRRVDLPIVAIDPSSRAASLLTNWWNDHSTLISLLACARVFWPQFLELHECVFWVPPGQQHHELIEHLHRYGFAGWASVPLAHRRQLAAQMGEQPLNHLTHVHTKDEQNLDADLVQELFDIVCQSWPPALAQQFPGRAFSINEVDRGDGLTIQLMEM